MWYSKGWAIGRGVTRCLSIAWYIAVSSTVMKITSKNLPWNCREELIYGCNCRNFTTAPKLRKRNIKSCRHVCLKVRNSNLKVLLFLTLFIFHVWSVLHGHVNVCARIGPTVYEATTQHIGRFNTNHSFYSMSNCSNAMLEIYNTFSVPRSLF